MAVDLQPDYPQHRWLRKADGTLRCLRCGIWRRGKGNKMQFARLPYLKGIGWTPPRAFIPPCVVRNPDPTPLKKES